MTFPSALTRPEEETLLSQQSGMLVKTLRKRRRVFFINAFTLFCLQLPHVRSDQVGETRKRRGSSAHPSPFPWEKEIEDDVALRSFVPFSPSHAHLSRHLLLLLPLLLSHPDPDPSLPRRGEEEVRAPPPPSPRKRRRRIARRSSARFLSPHCPPRSPRSPPSLPTPPAAPRRPQRMGRLPRRMEAAGRAAAVADDGFRGGWRQRATAVEDEAAAPARDVRQPAAGDGRGRLRRPWRMLGGGRRMRRAETAVAGSGSRCGWRRPWRTAVVDGCGRGGWRRPRRVCGGWRRLWRTAAGDGRG